MSIKWSTCHVCGFKNVYNQVQWASSSIEGITKHVVIIKHVVAPRTIKPHILWVPRTSSKVRLPYIIMASTSRKFFIMWFKHHALFCVFLDKGFHVKHCGFSKYSTLHYVNRDFFNIKKEGFLEGYVASIIQYPRIRASNPSSKSRLPYVWVQLFLQCYKVIKWA